MSNLLVIRGTPTNLRPQPSTSGTPVAQAVAGETGYVTNVKAGDDGYLWMNVHITNPDLTERIGWIRSDLPKVAGDFSLYGYGKYLDSFVIFQDAECPQVKPPANPNPSNLWICPVMPSTNENDFGNIYAGVKHDGVDLAGALNTPILASAPGYIFKTQLSTHGAASVLDVGISLNDPKVLNDVGWSYGYGNVIIVRFERKNLPALSAAAISTDYLFVLYAHCNDLVAKAGQDVIPGTLLAHRGKSGNADGVHTHLQVMTSKESNPSNVWGLPRINPHIVFQLP